MIPTLIVSCLILSANPSQAGAPQADAKLIRVYIHTGDGGHPTELGGRRESAKDLANWLADKKKDLVIVKDEDLADVVLEVMERSLTTPKVVFGIAGRPGQPLGAPARVVHLSVKLELTHDADSVDFKNKNAPLDSGGGWKSAADDIAKQVHKWITDRRAEILAAR